MNTNCSRLITEGLTRYKPFFHFYRAETECDTKSIFSAVFNSLNSEFSLFTFFRLLSSSLSPCLSQRFSRCTLRPSSGGWNVELNLLFRLAGQTVLVPEPCLMDVSYQLSLVDFPSESSPLPSPGIELSHFGYVTGSNQRLYPLYPVHNKVHNTSSQKYRQISEFSFRPVAIPRLNSPVCPSSYP